MKALARLIFEHGRPHRLVIYPQPPTKGSEHISYEVSDKVIAGLAEDAVYAMAQKVRHEKP